MGMMTGREVIEPNAIAEVVLEAFDKLPAKCKPRPRSDGSREWIPLAGIVMAKDGKLECVSLGTGMKCLPTTKLAQAQGNILHDWHAEVLALRAFDRFLLDECLALLTPPYTRSQYILRTDTGCVREREANTTESTQPFTLRDDVSIHMYCSEAPCGDASMELVMEAQEDATPWTSAPPLITESVGSAPESQSEIDGAVDTSTLSALRGRSNFSLLGAVRLKPSRPDAPPTLSKSCTDKLSLKQCTSLLSSLPSLLISPKNAYLQTLVLPDSQYLESACGRAFSHTGRMSGIRSSLTSNWSGGYRYRPFEVKTTSHEFAFSRRSLLSGEKAVPCNLSAVHTPRFTQTLIGGILQGRKQFDPRGASAICRRNMWAVVAEIGGLVGPVGVPLLLETVRNRLYTGVKENEALKERRKVKEDVRRVLGGWVRGRGDAEWGLDGEVEVKSV